MSESYSGSGSRIHSDNDDGSSIVEPNSRSNSGSNSDHSGSNSERSHSSSDCEVRNARRRGRGRRNRRRNIHDDSDSDSHSSSKRKKEIKKCKEGFPLNFDLKIKAKSDDCSKALSSHCYYPSDCPSNKLTKAMIEKRDLEGQVFRIQTKYEDIYEIIYSSEDYEMKDWKLCVEENEKKEDILDVFNSKENSSGFLIKKIPDTNFYYIRDALTAFYLNENKEEKRDLFSNYVIAEKEPKTQWEIIPLENKN